MDKSPGISVLLATLRRWPAEIGLKSEQRCCSLLTHCTTGHSPGTTPRLGLASAVIDIDASRSPDISAKRDQRMNPNRCSCTRLPTPWLGFDQATGTSGFALPALLVTGGSAPTAHQRPQTTQNGSDYARVATKSFGLEDRRGLCRAPSVKSVSTRRI